MTQHYIVWWGLFSSENDSNYHLYRPLMTTKGRARQCGVTLRTITIYIWSIKLYSPNSLRNLITLFFRLFYMLFHLFINLELVIMILNEKNKSEKYLYNGIPYNHLI